MIYFTCVGWSTLQGLHAVAKKNSSYKKKVALPPGSLVHVGKASGTEVRLTVIAYDASQYYHTVIQDLSEVDAYAQRAAVTWLNIEGLHDTRLLEAIGNKHSIHPLTLEDILNTNQRPKADFFDEYVYFVLKMIRYDNVRKALDTEQISLVLLPNMVITFQEHPGDVLDPLRQRLEKAKGRVRHESADFLFYSIIDVIIDHYFVCLEDMGEEIEGLEAQALENPVPGLVPSLQHIKRDLLIMRKGVWPLREQITALLREEHPIIQASTAIYLRDLYDHTIAIIDTVESFRDMTFGLLDVYLSSLSNRMNEVMKVLTIIATIFIPLTFIAGIYGMNFQHMPELGMKWAYPVTLGVCAVIAGAMLVFFRRKHWL
ncbi:MAG: magnesium/cobalt transporter CorA [Candidatus Hydrogenedentes bacterium]|nr:magnesium/cobalt transporter CorA [Candidatus Hydrogenedentota bacterium]